MTDNSVLTVLRSEKDITKPWLEALLKQNFKSNIEVLSWTSKDPAAKCGFMSKMSFLRVTYNGPNHSPEERSLVVKFSPLEEELLEFLINGNLAKKEIKFYKCVSTEEFLEFCKKACLKIPVPYVYWSDIKEELHTLVMHDLSTDGFRVDTPSEGNSLPQVKTAMKSIAVIHAFGIITMEKHGREYLYVPSGDFLDDAMKLGLNRLLDMFKGTCTEEALKEIYSKRNALINTRYPFFETLVHGDFWSGNIMFSIDNSSAVIIDWQFSTVDNPVCDILQMLLMSSNPQVYEQHLNDVLETYWQSLNEFLQKNGSSIDKKFQELVDAVENMWIFGFLFFAAALPELLDYNIMSEQRAKNAIKFLEKKNIFKKALEPVTN